MARAGTIHALYIRLRSTNGSWIAPPALRDHLVKDAAKQKANLHDVAVGILAARFRVPFEPSGRTTSPAKGAEELNLRVSGALWRALGAASSSSRQAKAIEVLAAHYGLDVPERVRRASVA